MKHTVVITKKPIMSGNSSIPDGALCGNGDLAAVLGSCKNGMRIFLGKNDIWCFSPESHSGGIRPLGYVDIAIPSSLYDNFYHVEQCMDDAKTVCSFRDGFNFINIELTVPATANVLLISMKWSRNFADIVPSLTISEAPGCKVSPFSENGVDGAYTDYVGDDYLYETHVKTGIKKVCGTAESAVYAVMACTNFDSSDYITTGLSLLEEMDEAVIAKLMSEHRDYWENFYSKSSVEIADKNLELDWYASQYLLAICRGKPMFPPGLYGNFITVPRPSWGGDYHLNYNFEAPFYAASGSNHPELTDYYHDPLFAAMEKGKENAADYLGCRGIYYPVALGPLGLFTEEDRLNPNKMFLGQKFCSAYAAVVMIMRWNATLDEDYARKILYPYLCETAAFWDDYLKNEKGKYVIYGDAIHEIPYYSKDFKEYKYKKEIKAKNSVLSLGAVRMIYSALLDLCDVIPEAKEHEEHWQNILNNLAKYPTKGGKYIYTQKGIKKSKSNTVGLQHFYPMAQAGADKKSLKLSKKTVEKTKRWCDDNGTNSMYPAAVRAGIPAEDVLKHYNKNKAKYGLPNKLYNHAGGCIENISIAAAMINEMLVKSFDGVIKVFPNWDKNIDCKFKDLRADGAFLVSAEIKNGYPVYVRIVSEKGAPLTVANPFAAKIFKGCNGTVNGETVACSGDYLEIDLPAGGCVEFTPAVAPKIKESNSDKKKAKKDKKKAKKTAKRSKKAAKNMVKDDKFYSKYNAKKAKKTAKKTAKKEKKQDKKYAKYDKKMAKAKAKRAKKRK